MKVKKCKAFSNEKAKDNKLFKVIFSGRRRHSTLKLKFWHYILYTTNKFDVPAYNSMKLFINVVMKPIYLFNIVALDYRKKIGFLVCKKENFTGLQVYCKHRKSA